MPHALVRCYGRGEQQAAWKAFDDAVDPDVPRIALCDTFNDEVEAVLDAATAFGEDLDGIRLDTTRSRRGDFEHIVREVRWALEAAGYEDIDIFVSGGLSPTDLEQLRDVADGFSVGSYISDVDPIDFSLDIVEIDGEPISKRGKLPGVKDVYRTSDGGHSVALADRKSPSDGESLLEPLLDNGEVVRKFDLDDAAARAATDAETVGFVESFQTE